MKIKLMFAAIVAACLATSVAFAQTPSEALQQAIFAQDVRGDIDRAIQGYRQVATSTFAPRDVAAHAQYRLSQALLQNRDVPAATRELERLRRDFAEYWSLIANLTESVKLAAPSETRAGIPSLPEFLSRPILGIVKQIASVESETGASVTLRGSVVEFAFGDEVFLLMDAEGRRYGIVLGTFEMWEAGGMPRFSPSETITVDARHPFSQPVSAGGILGLKARTITRADGTLAFKR
jgi:hypothetical protein